MKECKKILLIEDDEAIRRSMSDVLEFEGYEVATALHGLEALTMLKSWLTPELPSCIILDLMMPVMDGKSFFEFLAKERKELSAIPIIVSTAVGSHSSQKVSFAVETIRKPMQVEELVAVVSRHCGKGAAA